MEGAKSPQGYDATLISKDVLFKNHRKTGQYARQLTRQARRSHDGPHREVEPTANFSDYEAALLSVSAPSVRRRQGTLAGYLLRLRAAQCRLVVREALLRRRRVQRRLVRLRAAQPARRQRHLTQVT